MDSTCTGRMGSRKQPWKIWKEIYSVTIDPIGTTAEPLDEAAEAGVREQIRAELRTISLERWGSTNILKSREEGLHWYDMYCVGTFNGECGGGVTPLGVSVLREEKEDVDMSLDELRIEAQRLRAQWLDLRAVLERKKRDPLMLSAMYLQRITQLETHKERVNQRRRRAELSLASTEKRRRKLRADQSYVALLEECVARVLAKGS